MALRRFVEYLAYRAVAFAVPLLPRRVMVWLGRRLGGLYFLLSPRTRRVGLENLRRVFPDRTDHRRILRRAVRQQSVALLDALWSARLTPQAARRYVDFAPPDVAMFQELFARGRGVVIATAHFGSWEMLNLAAGAAGLPKATFIARPVRNPWIDRHLRKSRERTGNRLVYRAEALPACVAALKRGEVVCSVIDVAVLPSEGGIYADFCGTPALTSAALPLLAVRFKAPLVFAVCRPEKRGLRYVVEGEVIEVRESADRDGELRRLTAALSHALEKRVLEHPEAWIWGYKRWKWRPSELPGDFPEYSLWVHPLW